MRNRHRNQKLRRKIFGDAYRWGNHYYRDNTDWDLLYDLDHPLPTRTEKPYSRWLAWAVAAVFIPYVCLLASLLSPSVVIGYSIASAVIAIIGAITMVVGGYRMAHSRLSSFERISVSCRIINWRKFLLFVPLMPILAIAYIAGKAFATMK